MAKSELNLTKLKDKSKSKSLLHLLLVFIFVILLVLSFFKLVDSKSNENEGSEKVTSKRKLQIGIKKRPEVCERKSKKGDLLHIHYRGKLEATGTEFDNSYKRGQALTFQLGVGQVIEGWDQGLIGMCAGEKRKLIIPSELAYGKAGAPPSIPPDSTLIFEVECVQIEDKRSEL